MDELVAKAVGDGLSKAPDIAATIGADVEQVRKVLRRLVDRGAVEVIPRSGKGWGVEYRVPVSEFLLQIYWRKAYERNVDA